MKKTVRLKDTICAIAEIGNALKVSYNLEQWDQVKKHMQTLERLITTLRKLTTARR